MTRSSSPTNTLEGLRVDLQELEVSGTTSLEVSAELPRQWLESALSGTDADVAGPGRVDLSLVVHPDGTVVVRGRLHTGFCVPCARCLEAASVPVRRELFVTYVAALSERAGRAAEADEDPDGASIAEEDLDLYTYAGHVLELEPMVMEQVALEYPMRALCPKGESCRGLCTGCGADLNELGEEATKCAGCGIPLGQVSQAAEDRGKGGPQDHDKPDTPWQAALKKLQDGD